MDQQQPDDLNTRSKDQYGNPQLTETETYVTPMHFVNIPGADARRTVRFSDGESAGSMVVIDSAALIRAVDACPDNEIGGVLRELLRKLMEDLRQDAITPIVTNNLIVPLMDEGYDEDQINEIAENPYNFYPRITDVSDEEKEQIAYRVAQTYKKIKVFFQVLAGLKTEIIHEYTDFREALEPFQSVVDQINEQLFALLKTQPDIVVNIETKDTSELVANSINASLDRMAEEIKQQVNNIYALLEENKKGQDPKIIDKIQDSAEILVGRMERDFNIGEKLRTIGNPKLENGIVRLQEIIRQVDEYLRAEGF